MVPSNHFQLFTLGRLGLDAPPGADQTLGKQRRKLAVLAVLALSGRPVSRHTLVEMFWGDQDEARARHSLSEALSHLRRALGADAVTTRQAEVALAEDVPLRVDAMGLARAVEEGAYDRAIEVYGGAFLDGVYVGGSASFEEWADRERRRLEALFVRACEERCALLAREGRWEECAGVAQRWLEADPLSVRAACTLLDSLSATGTREDDARALREYERLRTRLERELDLSPDPVVEERAARIRARLAAGGEESAAGADGPPRRVPGAGEPSPAPPPAPPPAESGAASGGLRDRAAPRRPLRWRIVAALALLAVAAAGALLLTRPERDARAPQIAPAVAVLPFAVRGAADLGYLRAGMVDLLSASLDGAGAFRSVDPRAVLGTPRAADGVLTPADGRAVAERLGAGLYVLGDVVAAGERIRITAALYDADRPEPLTRATVEGTPAELFALVDRLTAQLLAARPREPGEQLASIAAVTTSSLPALKAYLEGESHYRAGEYVAAFEAFQRAAGSDSTFALAHYRVSQSSLWASLLPWDSVVERSGQALRHAGRLNRRERLLVEALHAWHRGAYDAAERLYGTVVAMDPTNVEAWYQLGEVRFHSNPLRGRSFVEAREPLERVISLEPDHLPAIVHLLRVAARERRTAEVDSLVARAKALMPDSDETWVDAFHAFTSGDPASRDRAFARLRGAPDEIVRISAERVAIYPRELAGARRVLKLLVQPPRLPEARGLGQVQLAELEVAHGRWRAAQADLRAAVPLAPVLALEHRALLAALPFLRRPPAELVALRDTLLAWDAPPPPSAWPVGAIYEGLHPHIRTYLVGLLSTRLEDSAGIERSVRELGKLGASGDAQSREFARGLQESVRGHAAATEGRHAEALAAFDRGRLNVSEGLLESPFGSQALERFARAEALRAVGRNEEALRWYASLAETNLHQIVYLAISHLRQGEIAEALGDRRRAARHYAAFVALWAESDPELRPLVEEARRRLARLRRDTE